MQVYQYKARDKFGKLSKGTMGADSQEAVASKLTQANYTPISISLAKEAKNSRSFFSIFEKVKLSDINMFTRQFYALQKAGLPVLSSLGALREQVSSLVFKDIIGQIQRDIEAGLSLHAAFEKRPEVFNNLYVNIIKSGEATGRLDEALDRLASLGEREEVIRMRLKAATRYPLIVVLAIIIGFIVLTTLVVPRFSKIYSQFTTKLPLPTQILLGINYAITKYWWLLIIIGAGVVYAARRFINSKPGRFWWDGIKLKIPVFGALTNKLIMSRFTRTSGTLMHSGIPILQILDLTCDSVGNAVISQVIGNIKASVNEGKGMLEPMKLSGMFPAVVIQMVAAGEGSGKLDELLLHASDYYDSQIDYTINNLVSLIEPILIFVLGLAVLFMALGIFMPMWNLASLFRR